MNSDRYAKVAALFERAAGLGLEARKEYLERECNDDPELRKEVEALLGTDADEGVFSERTMNEQRAKLEQVFEEDAEALAHDSSTWMPQRIGPYEVVRIIGRGGMGIVLEARQQAPSRRVAIKLAHPGLASDQVLSRLRREAEVLGRLQHPGIGQIFGVGLHALADQEQPYLVMELIEGRDLLSHANAEGLDRRARVEQLAQVCDGVEHAHARGVVHRDLKPDNVLVDRTGQPKLLDFGIARIADGDPQLSLQTREGEVLGTVAYMAPEQAAGRADQVGPATDIYSLGVLAYQLLTGRLPHDLAGLSFTRALDTIARDRPTPARVACRDLERDLATILGKALENRPQDRFASAASFAADLRRFLAHRTITARPPSRMDRVRKFVRRNRLLTAAALTVLGVLLVGILATTLQSLRTERLRRQTRRELYRAEMLLASEAAMQPGGLDRVEEIAERWELLAEEEDLRGWEWYLLDAMRSRRNLVIPLKSFGLDVDWHPASDRIAVAQNGGVEVFDALHGERVAQWTLESSPSILSAIDARFSPEGERLAISGANFIGVWTVGQPELDSVQPRPRDAACVWDSSGASLYLNDPTGLIRLDAQTGSESVVIGDHSGTVQVLDISPNGTHLAALGESSAPQVYNLATGERTWSGATPQLPLLGISLSDDPLRLAAVGHSAQLRITELNTDAPPLVVDEQLQRIYGVDWHPEGTLLATAGQDSSVRIYNGGTGRRLESLQGHSGYVRAVRWSPDGTHVASASVDQTARIWDMTEPSAYRLIDVFPYTERIYECELSWSADSTTLAVSYFGGTVLLDMPAGASRGLASAAAAVISPNGERLAPKGMDPWITQARGGQRVASVSLGEERVRDVAWSPSGSLLALSNERVLRVFATDGDPRPIGEFQTGEVTWGLAWLPDEQYIAVSIGQRPITLLDVRSATSLRQFPLPVAVHAAALAVDPKGELLAAGCSDGKIRLWFTADGAPAGVLSGHTGEIVDLSWQPDGRRLASGSSDGSVKLWDPDHAALCGSLDCASSLEAVAWRPDGALLVALSADAQLHLWDASTSYEPAVR